MFWQILEDHPVAALDYSCTQIIIGLTSYGKVCALKKSPAIYTRVSAYLDWIKEKVWGGNY